MSGHGHDVIHHTGTRQSGFSLLTLGQDSEGRRGVPRSKGVELFDIFCIQTSASPKHGDRRVSP